MIKKILEIYHQALKEEPVNIFEAFTTEEPYRDFLWWLLNPNASHGLKDKFTKLFLRMIAKIHNKELLDRDFENIKTEKEINSIDLVVSSPSFFCAIEMKLKSYPHEAKRGNLKQLEHNQKDIEDKMLNGNKYPNNENKFMICLDPKEKRDEDYDGTNFKHMNWWTLALLLTHKEIYDGAPLFLKALIKQFIKRLFDFMNTLSCFDDRSKKLKMKRDFELYNKYKGGSSNGN